jgi:tetratricopeptide (TPR) repeat protein/Zn-dependent protease
MTDPEILEAINNKKARTQQGLGPVALLLASGALYLVIGAQRWNLETTLLLVAALVIHESGHLIAMKVCRYKNLKMLFIPFFGAVASGEPSEQDSFKIAIIALSGPIAGLLAAAVAVLYWTTTHNSVLLDFAFISVLLNGFNLLPIVPLDGGHFLNEVLLAKYPKAELGFKILAVIALFVLAVRFNTFVLAVIGIFILLALKVSYDMAMAVNSLRTMDGIKGGELTAEKIGTIREAIVKANRQLGMMKFAQKLPANIDATWAKINKAFPTPGSAALLLAVYLAIILVIVPIGLRRTATLRNAPAIAYNQQGLAKLASGDYAAAISNFDQAIALRPRDAVVLINRGYAKFATRDFDGALPDLTQGINLKGGDRFGYYIRGLAKAAKGQFREAIADYDLALPLKTDDPNVYMSRGDAEARVGDANAALRDLDRSISLDAKPAGSWWIRGLAKDLLGDFAGAAKDYETAAKLAPGADIVRFRWSIALRHQHLDDRQVGLEAAVPKIGDPWAKAIALYLTGRLSEKELLLDGDKGAAETRRRHECQALYYIGMIHLLENEPDAARVFFKKAVDLDIRVLSEFALARAELARISPDGLPSDQPNLSR